MLIIILLISISLSIALFFLGAFVWNMKNGQYDDTYGPSVRMLFDDKPKKKADKITSSNISSKEL
jgi:cbb3-type cytochrome oxidase maturation protein